MAAEQERQLGHRNRAFARRIAARARPATVTGGSSAVPGWIRRAREDAASLAKGGIQPRVRPAATLRLARPVTIRPVEDAPPLPLARPVAAAAEIEPALEVPQPTPRTAPEPTAAPFRMADVRRELASRAEGGREARQGAPIQAAAEAPPARRMAQPAQPTPGPDGAALATTRPAGPAPTPSKPAPLRRAISRLEEEPEQEAAAERTQVEADATVEREPAPTEAALPAAAPTPPPTEDGLPGGAERSPNEDEGRARHAVPLPVAPEAQEARPVHPLPVDTGDQPPSVEAPQAVAPQPPPELGTAPPLVGASDVGEAEPRPEPGAPPPLVGARPAAPSRPAEAQEARPVRPLPVDTADQPPAAEAPPVAPPSTTTEPPPLRRRPVSAPAPPAELPTESLERGADTASAVEQARVGVGPAEPSPRAPEATPAPGMVAQRAEQGDRDEPLTPDASRMVHRPATPEPDAQAAGVIQAEEGRLPRQAVPLEEALFGEAAAAEPPPGAEERPIAPSTAAPAGASEPGPPVRRMMAQTPSAAPPDGPPVPAPIRRAPASPPAPAAQPEPEVTVRRQSEAESAPAPATAAPSTGASETQAEPAAQPSVQEIAEEVWALIRDRVRVERERLGRP